MNPENKTTTNSPRATTSNAGADSNPVFVEDVDIELLDEEFDDDEIPTMVYGYDRPMVQNSYGATASRMNTSGAGRQAAVMHNGYRGNSPTASLSGNYEDYQGRGSGRQMQTPTSRVQKVSTARRRMSHAAKQMSEAPTRIEQHPQVSVMSQTLPPLGNPQAQNSASPFTGMQPAHVNSRHINQAVNSAYAGAGAPSRHLGVPPSASPEFHRPAAHPAGRPVVQQAGRPVAHPVAHPAGPVASPLAHPAGRPVAQPVARPAAKMSKNETEEAFSMVRVLIASCLTSLVVFILFGPYAVFSALWTDIFHSNNNHASATATEPVDSLPHTRPPAADAVQPAVTVASDNIEVGASPLEKEASNNVSLNKEDEVANNDDMETPNFEESSRRDSYSSRSSRHRRKDKTDAFGQREFQIGKEMEIESVFPEMPTQPRPLEEQVPSESASSDTQANQLLQSAATTPTANQSTPPGKADTHHLDSLLGSSNTVPFIPEKSTVQAALNQVTPQVRQCGLGLTGRVVVRVVISGASGRVVSGEVVDNAFAGTPIAQCVENTLKTVRVPAFQKQQLVIMYPYNL